MTQFAESIISNSVSRLFSPNTTLNYKRGITFSMITIAMALSGMLSKHLKKQGHLKHLKNKQKNILLGGPYQQFTPTSQKSEQQDNPFQQKLAVFCDKGLISCVVMTPKQKWDESQ